MHTVVVKRALAHDHPEIVRAVYKAFCAAKSAAQQQLVHMMIFNNMGTMVPWITRLIDRDKDLLGADWWPYGIEPNRKTLDSVLRYPFEQGITRKLYTIKKIFVPALLGA